MNKETNKKLETPNYLIQLAKEYLILKRKYHLDSIVNDYSENSNENYINYIIDVYYLILNLRYTKKGLKFFFEFICPQSEHINFHIIFKIIATEFQKKYLICKENNYLQLEKSNSIIQNK